MGKAKRREELRFLIRRDYSDGCNVRSSLETNARISADEILHHYFVIRKPKWLAKRYRSD